MRGTLGAWVPPTPPDAGPPVRAAATAAAGLAAMSLAGGAWGVVTFGGNLQWSSTLTVALALMMLGLLVSHRSAAFAAAG